MNIFGKIKKHLISIIMSSNFVVRFQIHKILGLSMDESLAKVDESFSVRTVEDLQNALIHGQLYANYFKIRFLESI